MNRKALAMAAAAVLAEVHRPALVLAHVADDQLAAEDVVAFQPQLRLGKGGEAVADRLQPDNELVERREVADLDELLYASTHLHPPRQPRATE